MILALALTAVLLGAALVVALRKVARLRSATARLDRALADTIALGDMAEKLADLGRWRANPAGAQEWSNGLCRIVGVPAGMAPDDETQREMMVDGGATFRRVFEENQNSAAPFAFDVDIVRFDGQERVLRVIARNIFGDDGRLVERHGVALDVTERRREVAALAAERVAALAAAEEARRLAETDALTGLANRRRAMAEADRAALASAREGEPLAMLVFDIDHFKAVNDRYGHPAGDAVLVKVADLARRSLRDCDTVGRIGGEEFLCILPGADLAIARACAERLRQAIAADSAVEGVPAVTISLGYAGWRKGDSALALFARADAALYAAKQAGRDCVKRAA